MMCFAFSGGCCEKNQRTGSHLQRNGEGTQQKCKNHCEEGQRKQEAQKDASRNWYVKRSHCSRTLDMKVETDTTEKSEILLFIKAGLRSRLYLFHIGCYDRRVASADGHREPKILPVKRRQKKWATHSGAFAPQNGLHLFFLGSGNHICRRPLLTQQSRYHIIAGVGLGPTTSGL